MEEKNATVDFVRLEFRRSMPKVRVQTCVAEVVAPIRRLLHWTAEFQFYDRPPSFFYCAYLPGSSA